MSDSEQDPELVEESRAREGDSDVAPQGKLLPLNSRRLTTAHLKQIADSLELPSSGSGDELRQLTEEKLQESHDVHNVQVVVEEAQTVTLKLSLMDEGGVFLESTPSVRPARDSKVQEDLRCQLSEAKRKNEELEVQLVETEERLAREQRETAILTEELSSSAAGEEVSKLKHELKHERERAKQAWRLSCAQVTEQENLLAKREDEIAELKQKLRVSLHDDSIRSHSSGSESESHDLSPDVRMEHVRRRGKAPPADTFTGEDADLRFDDWLPTSLATCCQLELLE